MAALLGVDVDRTIALTFVIGAALAAVAGLPVHALLWRGRILPTASAGRQGLYRRRARRHRLAARRRAGRAAIGLIETLWAAIFLQRLQGCRGLLDPGDHADLHALRPARPARRREGVTVSTRAASLSCIVRRVQGARRSPALVRRRPRLSRSSPIAPTPDFNNALALTRVALVLRSAAPLAFGLRFAAAAIGRRAPRQTRRASATATAPLKRRLLGAGRPRRPDRLSHRRARPCSGRRRR